MNIENIGNYDLIILQTLRNENIPLFVYGFGDVGKAVYKKMDSCGIAVTGILLDDIYYECDSDSKANLYSFSIMQKTFNRVNIIAGFSDYDKIAAMSGHSCINNVFLISNPYAEVEDLTWEYYQSKKTDFENAYNLLEDEKSREIFEGYLNTRINNDARYMLGLSSKDSFFKNDVFKLSSNMTFVDAGAYTGDTLIRFIDSVGGRYKKAYAFEPDEKNFSALSEHVSRNLLKNAFCFREGLWSEKCVLPFSGRAEQESMFGSGDDYISVNRMDALISKDDRVDLIKLNTQGSELHAIEGARRIIEDDAPVIVSAIFMKRDFLYSILKLIANIMPGYRFYLRCENSFFAKVLLYAVYKKSARVCK